MKNIQFEEVGMENYGPYIDPMILQFKNNNLVLITGQNGIGKTMALDAIPFTLYGVTSKGAKGDDVVNNKIEKNCRTWVKFKVNNDQFLVTRYHKYKKYGNTVIINQNGVDIKQGHKETLPMIERLICPQKAFMNALMFGQKVKDFFTDLPDSQKKEIFRKVLDLEIFLTYYKFSDKAMSDITDSVNKIQTNMKVNNELVNDSLQQIQILNQAKNSFEKSKIEKVTQKKQAINDSERLLDQWKKNLDELKSQDINIEETSRQLINVENMLRDLSNVYDQKLKDLDSRKTNKKLELQKLSQKAENEIKTKYSDLLSQLQEKKLEVTLKSSEILKKLQDEIHTYNIEINTLQGKCKFLQDKVNEIESNINVIGTADNSRCSMCEQEVTPEAIDILKRKVEDCKKEILCNKEKIKELSETTTSLNKKVSEENQIQSNKKNDIESQIRQTKESERAEYMQISQKLNSAVSKVDALASQEVSSINKEKSEKSESLKIEKEQVLKSKKEKEEIITKIQSHQDNIKNIENDVKNIERQIKEVEVSEYDNAQLNSYIKKRRDYAIVIDEDKSKVKELDILTNISSFWKTGFSSAGIPSMLIDEAIPYMNERVDHYLEMLTNGRYIVSFDTLAETKSGEIRDKINVHVLDTQTKANSKVQLSGGQTRIIDIAVILTLGDLLSRIQNITFNILLFDEIFDALDEQNIQYVSKVLSKIKTGKSIFIISHQHPDHLDADEVLSFR